MTWYDDNFDRYSLDGQYYAALWAALVHAMRAELNYARFDDETIKAVDRAIRYDDAVNQVIHWRTQAANLERERNDAQAAELRALKNVERITKELQHEKAGHAVAIETIDRIKTERDVFEAELQAARMPDEVRETIRSALGGELEWHEAYGDKGDPADYRAISDVRDALAWLDGLGAGKDVTP